MVEAALVIGYGNGLRGDDGIGPQVAEAVARSVAPPAGVTVRICHQLVPELADDLRDRQLVVFVDATTRLAPGAVATRSLTAADAPAPSAGPDHRCTPGTLIRLAERLYGARPAAFLVTVGAAAFAHGEGLSPAVAAALPQAVAAVRRLIDAAIGPRAAAAPATGEGDGPLPLADPLP
jgi:hydrogenase maturation protease